MGWNKRWGKPWRKATMLGWIWLMSGCASSGTPTVVYLPADHRSVFVQPGDTVGFDGVCLQKGTYLKCFRECAEALVEPVVP